MAPGDDKTEMTRAPSTAIVAAPADDLERSVVAFNAPLAHYMDELGLPTRDVLAPMDDRRMVIQNLERCLEILPISEREQAYYLTKFSVSIAVGLFDAAINYLWNESVAALRRKVADLDLQYFFDIAEKREKYRAQLVNAEDLSKIEDIALIDACSRMGLLTDVNRERLRHVNYMRNHASAAHPNDAELNGAEMLSWLTNCLKYAILAEPDASVVQVNRLLHNVRTTVIPEADSHVIAAEIVRLPQERLDDLIWTLFGQYTDTNSSQECRSNIAKITPAVWEATSEGRRYAVGARHAVFLKNADVARKDLSTEFLKHVGGLRYRSEDVLVAELLEKLRTLEQVHHAGNNFYNEWPHAAALREALPQSGIVPAAVRREWVKVISMCWIGNGHGYKKGVDDSAEPHYAEQIRAFGEAEIHEFLDLFSDPSFTVDFGRPKSGERVRALAKYLKDLTKNIHQRRALDMVGSTPDLALRRVHNVSDFQRALAASRP